METQSPLVPNHASLNPRALTLRGILSIAFGILILAWPGSSLLALAFLWGAYAFADGIMAIRTGFRQSQQHRSWGLPIFEGILGILAGVLTFFWPGMTLLVLSIFVGAWALMTGILEIIAAFQFRSIVPTASVGGRILLGIVGVLSVVLGAAIFMNPAIGTLTLLGLVASYAILAGVMWIALGSHLRRSETSVPHSLDRAA